MDLLEQLDVEHHNRTLAQNERCTKRQALASKQETLRLQARGVANQISLQGPLVAQALSWAEGVWQMAGPTAQQAAKAHLDAILAKRQPSSAQNNRDSLTLPRPDRPPPSADHPAPSAFVAPSAFLAHIAHELRTPLTGIVGMADVLADTVLTADQRLILEPMKSAALAALVLTNDILDHAKIKAQGLTLLSEPFDLEAVIRDITTLMQPAARAKGIRLLLECDPQLPSRFIGDPGRVRQVVTNLVANAVKFTPQGQVRIQVLALEARQDCNQVHITVEDTGIGIGPDDLARIFDEYHQASPNSGLGLGLTLAKRLVEGMGGTIWVESDLGRGSSFGLHLPLRVAEGSVFLPDLPVLVLKPTGPRPMRILAAEDNRTNQLVFQKMVRDLAVDVVFANTGQEAVDLFQSFEPDLIFMDIAMPQMDGRQAALAIRQIEAGRSRLPIIALSAHRPEEETDAILAAGIDRYMTKPLQKSALRDVIITHCPKAAYVVPPAAAGYRSAAQGLNPPARSP